MATPALPTANVCSVEPSNGLATCTSRASASRPPSAHVAAAVDDESLVARQQRRELVSEHALGDATGIDPHATRPRDGAGAAVGPHVPPARIRRGPSGRAIGREGERDPKRQADTLEVRVIAGAFDLGHERRVDQAARCPSGAHRGVDDAAHHRRDRHGIRGRLVQPSQLAAGLEPRELPVPFEQPPASLRDGRLRVGHASVGHDHRALRAEAGERLALLDGKVDRRAHDWLVVTLLTVPVPEFPLELELVGRVE